MKESEFKSKMTLAIRTLEGGYARRYEDQYAVGLPDVIAIPKGGPVFFIEVKSVPVGFAWGPTPRQLEELHRIEAAGGGAIPVMMAYRGIDDTVHIDFPEQKLKLPGVISFPRIRANYSKHLCDYAKLYLTRMPAHGRLQGLVD